MTQITDNKAAWLPFEKAPALEVGPSPIPNPADNEVVIKVAYAAVNPTDWIVRLSLFELCRSPAYSYLDARPTLCPPTIPFHNRR